MNLIPITPDPQRALAEAGDSPVELVDWAKLAKKARVEKFHRDTLSSEHDSKFL